MQSAFTPGASGTIAVTDTSARLAVTGTGFQIYVNNVGEAECFIAWGDSTVTAIAGGDTTAMAGSMSVGAGAFFVITIGDATHIAAIAAEGTTTLRLTRGDGA